MNAFNLKEVKEVQEVESGYRLYENSNTFEIASLSALRKYSISCTAKSVPPVGTNH